MAQDVKQYQKEYREKNKDHLSRYAAEWRAANREKIKADKSARYERDREKILAEMKVYRDSNPEREREKKRSARLRNHDKIRKQESDSKRRNRPKNRGKAAAYARLRHATDPMHAMKVRLRARLGLALRNSGYTKKSSMGEILGCSWDELQTHIESKFLEGMSWGNRSEWHIDHVIPLATAKNEADLMTLSHYTNLQPLWTLDNLKKSAKL